MHLQKNKNIKISFLFTASFGQNVVDSLDDLITAISFRAAQSVLGRMIACNINTIKRNMIK